MAQLYYSPVTVNTGQVPSTQTDFPVLVSYTDARFKTTGNGGHVANANGYDIRPYSDSGLTTAITGYELERYNASTGEVVMWVKRSSLADGNVTYLGYGDTTLTTDGSSTTTWSNGFGHVLHLADGSTLSVKDSVTGTNGTNHSATATSGKIDGACSVASASSQYIQMAAAETNSTSATLSAWVNGTSFPNAYNPPVTWENPNSTFFYMAMYIKSNGKLAGFAYFSVGGDTSFDGTGSTTLSTGQWYYVVLVADSTFGLRGYVNAVANGTAANAHNLTVSNTVTGYVGRSPRNSLNWNGPLDEARISGVARSADWITTEYNNQSAPATFATLGTEVSLSVTRPGWFVFF